MAKPRASPSVRPPTLAAPLVALALLLSGCLATGGDDDAGDATPDGPHFLFVLDNQADRDAVAHLRVTGPAGGTDVEGDVVGPANAVTNKTIPLARDGPQRLDITYQTQEGSTALSGTAGAAFDSSECTGVVRVTLRLTTGADGGMLGGASSYCVPAS